MRLLPRYVARASRSGVSVADFEEKRGSALISLFATSFFASITFKHNLTFCTISFLCCGTMLWERVLTKKLNSQRTSSGVARLKASSNAAFFGSGGAACTGFGNSILGRFFGLLPWSSPRFTDIHPLGAKCEGGGQRGSLRHTPETAIVVKRTCYFWFPGYSCFRSYF